MQVVSLKNIQDKEFITLDQYDYAKNVTAVKVDPGRRLQRSSELTAAEKTQYLSLLGKLSWLFYITSSQDQTSSGMCTMLLGKVRTHWSKICWN